MNSRLTTPSGTLQAQATTRSNRRAQSSAQGMFCLLSTDSWCQRAWALLALLVRNTGPRGTRWWGIGLGGCASHGMCNRLKYALALIFPLNVLCKNVTCVAGTDGGQTVAQTVAQTLSQTLSHLSKHRWEVVCLDSAATVDGCPRRILPHRS